MLSQDTPSRYYVVIGAFEDEVNAKEWVEFSQSHQLEADYQQNTARNLYYVYSTQSDNKDVAVKNLYDVWEIKGFQDAWIYLGNFKTQHVALPTIGTTAKDTTEEAGQLTASIAEPPKTQEMIKKAVVVESDEEEELKHNLGDYTIFFNLFNAQDSKDVIGEVNVIDAERAKLIQTISSGEYVTIPDPNNGTGKISLIVETFGYRKLQHEINYYEPIGDTSSLDIDIIGDVKVYHFPLVRYNKGDIAIMYNVYFFIDAAIMRPESVYELENLLEMMQENSKLKIRIHGHTNGNSFGKIITVGDDKEFFALTEDDEEKSGSAKKLSEARADVIRDYLIANGIEPDRMEVKAWGGKRMLYDKHSSQAKNNVRVEVEILEN